MSELMHAPKCQRPGVEVTVRGDYSVTRCIECAAATTSLRGGPNDF
jgi:hypothetical protein